MSLYPRQIFGQFTSAEVDFLSTLAGQSWTEGDIIYIDSNGDAVPLNIGSNGEVLQISSGLPSWQAIAGTGDVTAASSFGTDNVLIRSDGTGKGVQASGITVSDTDQVSGVAQLTIDASGSILFGAVTILSDSAGTTTLSNIDALDATTEATIEAAIDTLPNLTSATSLGITESQISDLGTTIVLDSDIGSTVQAYDADLAGIAAATFSANHVPLSDGANSWSGITVTTFAQSVLDDANAATARTTLGLAIGTDVQSYDAGLASIAGLTTAADRMIYTTASDTYAVTTLTSFARSILDDADEATFKATVNLEIGTDVQAQDAFLQDIADLTDPGADRILFWDDSAGSVTWLTASTGLTISGTSITVRSASTTQTGIAEASIASEVNTGTDTARYISPDSLAGSNFGIRYVQIRVFEAATDTATGDGKATFKVPAGLDGMNLVSVDAEVDTAGTTGTTDIQIHNVDNALDMLSTKLTIDSAETGSDTAATPAVINTSNDHINTNDIIRIDVDAVSTTAAKGLIITLGFQLA